MTIAIPPHAPHPWFGIEGDCLNIGGRSVVDLATQAGQTPFYVYDRSVMTRKLRELRAVLPREVHVHYAMKANPMPAVVRHMLDLVDGLDVASAGEMQVALDAGAAPALVSFAGPGKTDVELARAAAAGITINIESEREIRVLAEIGARTGKRPRVAVRVNPDFELKTSGMKMGGGPKQFGIDTERVPEVLAAIGALPLDFQGFHIFSGSQNLRAEAIVEAQQKSVALAERLARHAPGPVRTLNIGGGFGIPYFPEERPLDIAPIAANLRELVPRVAQTLPGAQLVLELGRYLVGESGAYVCRVIDRKVSRGQVFLVCDGGLHHHLAASGNFGQVIRKNYPVLIGNRVQGTARETASVVGPLCTPLDLLADRMNLARAEEGDLVVVLQSGAYGLSSSPRAFLSHPPAVELLV
ncbi:MAG TPA: pyridoxal-dependent decarboxylase, exosortase A system-associated [Steroidobacteraceae bacterium]|nr:pyridoxal-dependent decarboxylase, exosortase A system-associated [Steroidobacteraceae bacterium]